MRVLHLSSERTWRGGEQQIAYLMKVLRSRGVENLLLARKNSEMAQRHSDALTASFHGEFDLLTALKIKRLTQERQIDLVHAHSGHGHSLAVLAATLGMRAPVIVSKRTDYPVKSHALSRWKFNHPCIKHFLCVSDKIRQIIARDLKEPSKALTVYSGIDPARFPSKPSINIRQLASLPNEARVVVSTAAISPQKDYGTFLKVAQETLHRHQGLHYVICGEGPSESEIKSQAQALKLKNVHFLGFRKDLVDFLGSADAFLITSKEEGLGTSILDAFSVGVPVVATAAGGIPEIVHHGETGLLAPVGDFRMLATHVENTVFIAGNLREKLIEGAHKLVQEFSYERTAEQTLAIYRRVMT